MPRVEIAPSWFYDDGPWYNETRLAELLNVNRTTLYRRRICGDIDYLPDSNGKRHTVWYAESMVRDYLSLRRFRIYAVHRPLDYCFSIYGAECRFGTLRIMWEPERNSPAFNRILDDLLACMRSGHSPFRAYIPEDCPRSHCPSIRDRCNYLRAFASTL